MKSGESLVPTVIQEAVRERLIAIRLTVALIISFLLVVVLSKGKVTVVWLFPLAVALLPIVTYFNLALLALPVSLFFDYYIWGFGNYVGYSAGVLFAIPLGFSFLLKHHRFRWNAFANPLNVPILLCGIAVLPSFINAPQPLISVLMMFNVVAFLIVMYALVGGLHALTEVRKLAIWFIAIVLVNGLAVVVQSILGMRRPFGFAGIMYVDYAGLAICAAMGMSLITRGRTRVWLILCSSFVAVTLVLTQTRNSWLSVIMTLGVLLIYILINPQTVGLTRMRLSIITVVGLVVLGGTIALVISFDPKVIERITDLAETKSYVVDEKGGTSSLISRTFIWDTALNAFLAHPVAGIGMYSFPFESWQYSRIPTFLFEEYVAGNSPHQTQLAVLAETGIIGGIAYLVFVVVALRTAFHDIKKAPTIQGRKYSFVAAIAVVYCFVSMLFTDAWLRGQGIILLGLVLGLMLANRKISASNSEGILAT